MQATQQTQIQGLKAKWCACKQTQTKIITFRNRQWFINFIHHSICFWAGNQHCTSKYSTSPLRSWRQGTRKGQQKRTDRELGLGLGKGWRGRGREGENENGIEELWIQWVCLLGRMTSILLRVPLQSTLKWARRGKRRIVRVGEWEGVWKTREDRKS